MQNAMHMELKIHSLSVERVDDVCYSKCSIGLTSGCDSDLTKSLSADDKANVNFLTTT